jgi:hypothetical protein
MKRWLIMLLLLVSQAAATVEDTALGSSSPSDTTGAVWPGYIGSSPTWSPTVPGSVWPPYTETGKLTVTVALTGSGTDARYITPGKTVEYTVTVKNEGDSEVVAGLTVDPGKCRPGWFSWTKESVTVPPGGVGSKVLLVKPDMSAVAGSYGFEVFATALNYESDSENQTFEIQDYDYVSETMVGGSGQFQISKDVRSAESGIKSNKDIYFSGSVDALVKNEYLVDNAVGLIPTFQECDAVDNYVALVPGDSLLGSESFKSSLVFSGIGAKVNENYNVYEMEFQKQNFNLHTNPTGPLGNRAEFQTADNFSGYFSLDAKQTIPGQKSIKESEEFLGSFEIQRNILFKRPAFSSSSCGDFFDCLNAFSASSG